MNQKLTVIRTEQVTEDKELDKTCCPVSSG